MLPDLRNPSQSFYFIKCLLQLRFVTTLWVFFKEGCVTTFKQHIKALWHKMYVEHISFKLQTTEGNFEKQLGWKVKKRKTTREPVLCVILFFTIYNVILFFSPSTNKGCCCCCWMYLLLTLSALRGSPSLDQWHNTYKLVSLLHVELKGTAFGLASQI